MYIGKKRKIFAIIIALVMTISVPMNVFASESAAMPAETMEQDIILVDLPTLQEDGESPFDFIIDPQNLMFETDAALYGGGVVEEGANLLFHNREEGGYDFSRCSDKLTVINRGSVPVMITISARIMDVDDMQIVQDKDFPEDGSCCVYLALVDDVGNEQPVSEEGEVSISVEMQRVPENTDDYASYSFGLTGECSSDADWSNISVHPKVTVTWQVEPILTEQKDEADEEEQLSEELQEDVKNEGVTDKGVKNEDVTDKDVMNEDVTDKDVKNEDVADKDTANKDIEY